MPIFPYTRQGLKIISLNKVRMKAVEKSCAMFMCELLISKMIYPSYRSSIRLFIFTNLLHLSSAVSEGSNSCRPENSTEECCTGFRKIKGECTECIGFIGINCGHPCEPGWYGPQCKLFCSCIETEICNQFVGCISASRHTSNTSRIDKGELCGRKNGWSPEAPFDTSILWQLAVGLLGILVCVLLALMGYLVRKRKWRQKLKITETTGHFRSQMDESSSDETTETRGSRFVHIDGHSLNRKDSSGETGEVYNHIHFKRVSIVQNSSDEYGAIIKHL